MFLNTNMKTSEHTFNWQDFERNFVVSKHLLVKAGAHTDASRIKQLILNSMNSIYAYNLVINLGASNNTQVVYDYDVFSPTQGNGNNSVIIALPASGSEIGVALKASLVAYALSTWGQTISPNYAIIKDNESDVVITPSESALSLSIQTSTGAVGTQVSATQASWVTIAGQVSTTASIAGNASGDIIVEVAPTNSATAGDWVEKGRIGNSQNLSLAITLQSVQIVKGQVVVFVPAGYYVKARSSGSGTVSYTLNTVRKVLI